MIKELIAVAIAEEVRKQANARGFTSADVLYQWEMYWEGHREVDDLTDILDNMPAVADVIRNWIDFAPASDSRDP